MVAAGALARADDDFVCRTARLFCYGEHGDSSDAPCDPTAPGNPPADAAEYGSWGALTEGDQPGSQKSDALLSLLCPAGDATLDCHVNGADLAIIQSNLNKTGMWWQQGDFNHDGTVNQADLDLYNQNVSK